MNTNYVESVSSSPIDDTLSTFLETYPTRLYYYPPKSKFYLWVFWSQIDDTSSSDDPEMPDPWKIHKKIRSALSGLDHYNFNGLIQFWAPVKIGDRILLTTSNQPFALQYLGRYLEYYRLHSLEYHYDIDVNYVEVEENPKIISGAPATAFLKRFPEAVMDLRVLQDCPLVRCALEFGFRTSIVMPFFSDPSQSCCIGVFEYYMEECKNPWGIVRMLNDLLKKQGLCPFNAEAHIWSKNICGLEHAKNEIDKALQVIVTLHRLELVQVWIAYEDENHVAFSSSLNDTRKKRLIGLPLTSQSVGRLYSYNNDNYYESYLDDCHSIPLVNLNWLVQRTLQNYKAHFTKKFSRFRYDREWSSCFTICLKNNETHDLLYVLEFLWDTHAHYIIMLEALLSTLQGCFPSFKFASGAQLGDELHVIDVDDSTGSRDRFFKILKGNRSSSIINPLDEGKRAMVVVEESLKAKCKTTEIELPLENIKQQFGRTMKEAAKNLNVSLSTLKRKCKVLGISEWQGPDFVKRKVNDSYNNQSDTNDEDDMITIKAEYGPDMIKFHLPSSSATFVAVEEEIAKKLKLNPRTYKLKYVDEDGDFVLLNSDQDMKDCIRSFGRNIVRLCIYMTNI